jgi:hypothetical protein
MHSRSTLLLHRHVKPSARRDWRRRRLSKLWCGSERSASCISSLSQPRADFAPQDITAAVHQQVFHYPLLVGWPYFRLSQVVRLVNQLQLTEDSFVEWYNRHEWVVVGLRDQLEVFSSSKRVLVRVHTSLSSQLAVADCPHLEDEVQQQTIRGKGKRRAADLESEAIPAAKRARPAVAQLAIDVDAPMPATDTTLPVDAPRSERAMPLQSLSQQPVTGSSPATLPMTSKPWPAGRFVCDIVSELARYTELRFTASHEAAALAAFGRSVPARTIRENRQHLKLGTHLQARFVAYGRIPRAAWDRFRRVTAGKVHDSSDSEPPTPTVGGHRSPRASANVPAILKREPEVIELGDTPPASPTQPLPPSACPVKVENDVIELLDTPPTSPALTHASPVLPSSDGFNPQSSRPPVVLDDDEASSSDTDSLSDGMSYRLLTTCSRFSCK